MSLLGVRLTLLIGPTVALPAPPPLIEAVHEVEVTHRDDGLSGFSITFSVGRAGPSALMDYALLASPLLRPFNRVIVVVTFNATPHVLMDGIISRQELAQGQEPGTSTLTIKGEDVSVAMDREERSAEHPAQTEALIAAKLILGYAQYGLIPVVIPPAGFDVPLPIERIPVQQGTDLDYLRKLAEVHGHVFYVTPGPVLFTNYAYWGPPVRVGLPQRAITVNMGPETNAKLDEAAKDGLGTTSVEGQVQDAQTGQKVPVRTFGSLRPPLASMPSWLVDGLNVRRQQLRESGANAAQAMAKAQGAMEATTDVVKLEGELDAGSYGGVLQARALVGVRGAGFSYDGLYYVRRVTHKIGFGRYSQRFELAREGLGSTTPVVPV
jgi:phage protein D